MRTDLGTSKVEGLCALQHTGGSSMSWGGRLFPVVLFEGEQLPEAFSCEGAAKLPRQMCDLESRFAKAIASLHARDDDRAEVDGMEASSIVISMHQREARQSRNA